MYMTYKSITEVHLREIITIRYDLNRRKALQQQNKLPKYIYVNDRTFPLKN